VRRWRRLAFADRSSSTTFYRVLFFFGRRTAALLRAFDLRCGLGPELERPSPRYASTPVDGPAKGQSVRPHWEHMLDVWYEAVGYDRKTGRPRPETLRALGLDHLIPALWGK